MDICFEGVGQVAATFQVDGETVQPGMAVTITGNGQVGLGKDGDAPCGVLLGSVRGGAAAVQIGGAAKVSWSGTTAPKAGWASLACDGAGGVKAVAASGTGTAASGVKCLVLAVDEETAVIKL